MKKFTFTIFILLLTSLAWSQHTTWQETPKRTFERSSAIPFGQAENPPMLTGISNFKLTERPAGLLLEWNSTEQDDFAAFQVFRSQYGEVWTQVAYLPAETTAAGFAVEYKYFDRHPHQGENHYSLRKIFPDGASAWSEPISVNYISNNSDYQFKVYPNPASRLSEIFVALETAEEPVIVDLLTLDGRRLDQFFIYENRTGISLGALPAGQYVLSYREKGQTPASKRLIVR